MAGIRRFPHQRVALLFEHGPDGCAVHDTIGMRVQIEEASIADHIYDAGATLRCAINLPDCVILELYETF